MSLGDSGDGLRVRPYAITGGRTRAATEVPIEAIVYRTPDGERAQTTLSLERGQILGLLTSPQSAAEISARLRLPLGVARVVLGDLVDVPLTAWIDVRTPSWVLVDERDVVRWTGPIDPTSELAADRLRELQAGTLDPKWLLAETTAIRP